MEPNSPSDGDEPLWTALDVARYFQVSRATVYNLANRGALPVVRIGAGIRFHPATVRDLARSARVPAEVVQLKQRKKRPPDDET